MARIYSDFNYRSEDVVPDDFDSVENFLIYDALDDERVLDVIEAAQLWNKYIPMTPKQAFEVLTYKLEDHVCVEISLDTSGKCIIANEGRGICAAETECSLAGKKVIEDNRFAISKTAQGSGLASRIMANHLEFSYLCGVRYADVEATLDSGSYSWARFGFLPEMEFYPESLEDNIGTAAQEILDILTPVLPMEDILRFQDLMKFNIPEDLWDFVDAPSDVTPVLKVLFDKAADDQPLTMERIAAQDILTKFMAQMKNRNVHYIEDIVSSGKPLKVQKLMMAKTSWNGFFDFRNEAQIQRAGDYAGGWQYLKIGA